MYGKQVKQLTKLHISSQKRKEIEDIIQNQNRPAFEKVPKVKRKTGKYYNIKFKKPDSGSLNKVNSLGEDNFYSEIHTQHDHKESVNLQEAYIPEDSKPQQVSIKMNNDNTLNLDLTGMKYHKGKKQVLQPTYNRTTVSDTHKNLLRASTPEYSFKVSPYKSKLWDSNLSNTEAQLPSTKIDRYIQKSVELKNRVRLKEQSYFGDRSGSMLAKHSEEVSDMLIDSILYKVNVLQNV